MCLVEVFLVCLPTTTSGCSGTYKERCFLTKSGQSHTHSGYRSLQIFSAADWERMEKIWQGLPGSSGERWSNNVETMPIPSLLLLAPDKMVYLPSSGSKTDPVSILCLTTGHSWQHQSDKKAFTSEVYFCFRSVLPPAHLIFFHLFFRVFLLI